MSVEYTYDITDFPNDEVNIGTLSMEILASSISVELDFVEVNGDTISVWFVSSISGPEQTTLDNIVANHDTGYIPEKHLPTGHSHNFTDLFDTPTTYSGYGTTLALIKTTEDGLRFSNTLSGIKASNPVDIDDLANKGYVDSVAGGKDDFIELNDTPVNYTGYGNYVVTVNPDEDAVEFSNTLSGIDASYPIDPSNIATKEYVDAHVSDMISGTIQEVPCIQIRRTTDYTYPTSWTDLTFDTTDVENAPDVIEHDNTNTDRIQIKEDGYYEFTYTFPIEALNLATFKSRVRVNDTTQIPGSYMWMKDNVDAYELSNDFICYLNAGDFVTMQVDSDCYYGDGTVKADVIFNVVKLTGAKGEKGDPGTGATVNVQKDGNVVAGNPFDTLNFAGFNSVQSTTSGTVTITANDIDEDKIIYVGKHGDDANDGRNLAKAVLTFGQAVSLVNSESPSVSNKWGIVCFDGGIYSENITISNAYSHVFAANATLEGSINIVGKSSVEFEKIKTTSGVALKLNGGSDTAYAQVKMLEISGGAKGIQCTDGDSILNVEVEYMKQTDGVGLGGTGSQGIMHADIQDWDMYGNATAVHAADGSGMVNLRNANLSDRGSGTTIAFDCDAAVTNAICLYVDCDTLYDVESGATLNLIGVNLSGNRYNNGDINITEAGGTGSHTHTESEITDLGDYASTVELTTVSGYLQSQIDTVGGDFADGGEAGGANRSLGNTDSYSLSLLTNNSAFLTATAAGNVGIGNTPSHFFEVRRTAVGDGNHAQFYLSDGANTDDYSLNIDTGDSGRAVFSFEDGSGRQAVVFGADTINTDKTIFGVAVSSDSGSSWNPALVATFGRKVGIGKHTPAEALDVAGNIALTGTVDGRDIAADGTAQDNHIESTANPHSVTAAQVGASPTGHTHTESDITDIHTHSNKSQLDLITDGDHDVRTDNPHGVDEEDVLPSQTGNSGKYLTTDGNISSWATVSGVDSVITKYVSTVSSWTLSGGIYYADITHNLNTKDVMVEAYTPSDDKTVGLEDIDRTGVNTIRIWSATNTENVRVIVMATNAGTAPSTITHGELTGVTANDHHNQSHGNSDHTGTYIEASDVTYENLNTNGDVGTGSTQVARGNHAHSTFDYGAILTSNSTYEGSTLTVTVDSASSAFGNVLAQAADFNYDLADADAAANSAGLVMALETGTGSKKVLLQGQICNTDWNWSAGLIYLSTTAGSMTQTAPVGTGDQVVVLGWALSSDTIFFRPSLVLVEVA